MTQKRKNEIISQILKLVNEIAEDSDDNFLPKKTVPQKVEMLTIKECTDIIHGLSEHTVRQLIAQNKIPHIRAGQGRRGKILINKADLLHYINTPENDFKS